MADDGEMTDVLKDFITKVQSKTALYLETKGNHDRHPYNYQGFDMPSFLLNSLFKADVHLTYADLMES